MASVGAVKLFFCFVLWLSNILSSCQGFFFYFACSHIFLTSLASSVLSCIHNSLYSVFLQYQWVQNKTPKSELLCDGLSWLRWFVCLSSLALIGSYFLIFLSFFSLIVDQQWMYNWFWWAAICTSRKKIRKCSMW